MIGASNILTVSYGTFSCTLEGFDEPFNTMKAIAEYFRDLAAEDRYFGAEPPTPDAAMLHRIAEREIHRRVEAKIQENGVILRAETAPEVRVEIAAPVAEQPQPAPRPAPLAEAEPESVAAKLLRIRSAVAAPTPVAEATPSIVATPAQDDYAEEEAIGALPDVAALIQPKVAEPVAQPEPAGEAFAPAEIVAAAPPVAMPTAQPEITDAFDDEPLLSSIAALTEAPAGAPVADQPEPAVEPQVAQDDALLAAIAALPAEDAANKDAPPQEQDAPAPASLAPVLVLVAAEAPEPALPETVNTVGAVAVHPVHRAETAEDAALLASLAAIAETPPETPAPTATAETLPEDAEIEASVEDFLATAMASEPSAAAPVVETRPEDFGAAADPAPLPEERPSLSEKLLRARARVIKIRRTEPPANAALSAQGDADLARERAAAEQARGPAAIPREEGDARRHLTEATGEDAVDRILEQTNSEMRGPENRRRLSALSHLKAAVAATVAERLSGIRVQSESSRLDPYRSDLARVVRPNRLNGAPVPANSERPAPLVLVSEQRIDRLVPQQPSAAQQHIRPRRVTAASVALEAVPHEDEPADEDDIDDNIFTDSKGFAEFADKLGATALPDLMEAAAAYTECVEGRPHFSRPHLIRHLSALAPEGGFSRESGLRSFGTLLRTGKLEKVKRGQFALTESSHYRAEARKIAR